MKFFKIGVVLLVAFSQMVISGCDDKPAEANADDLENPLIKNTPKKKLSPSRKVDFTKLPKFETVDKLLKKSFFPNRSIGLRKSFGKVEYKLYQYDLLPQDVLMFRVLVLVDVKSKRVVYIHQRGLSREHLIQMGNRFKHYLPIAAKIRDLTGDLIKLAGYDTIDYTEDFFIFATQVYKITNLERTNQTMHIKAIIEGNSNKIQHYRRMIFIANHLISNAELLSWLDIFTGRVK